VPAGLAVIAGGGLPPLRGGQLLSSQFPVVAVLMVLGALALYLWGIRRVHQLHPRHRWPRGRTAAFVAGLFATSVAVFSFVGVYQQELFYDHMIQHLLLIMVASQLFAMSSPVALAWRATSGRAHTTLGRMLRSRPADILGNPLVVFVIYAVLIPITHLTSWYNLTIEQAWIDDVEHLVFLAVGFLFWRHIFGADPNRHRMYPGIQFLYLFIAVPIDTFTGLSLDQASRELFPAYYEFHRTWGPSLVQDLHIGGVIMWVGGDLLMAWPMVPIAIRWMHLEERRGDRADRDLERELTWEADQAAMRYPMFPVTGEDPAAS